MEGRMLHRVIPADYLTRVPSSPRPADIPRATSITTRPPLLALTTSDRPRKHAPDRLLAVLVATLALVNILVLLALSLVLGLHLAGGAVIRPGAPPALHR